MSTNSAIGTLDPQTGQYRARCVHWDGYPTWMGKNLATLVARDGAEQVLDTITTRSGWSKIEPTMPDLTGVTPNPNAEHGSLERQAADFVEPSGIYGDRATWVPVPGYGVAHVKGSKDDWFTGTVDKSKVLDADRDAWIEWGYVFTGTTDTDHLLVLDLQRDTVVARIALPDLGDTDWGKIECGEQYERCSHYAWAHDKTIPAESKRIGMRKWLGLEPLTLDDAVAVTTATGERWELTGSGWLQGDYWIASANRNGKNINLPISRGSLRGRRSALPDLTYHYPPTKAA